MSNGFEISKPSESRRVPLFTDDVDVHLGGEFAPSVADRNLVVLQQCFLLSSLLGFGILAVLHLWLFEHISNSFAPSSRGTFDWALQASFDHNWSSRSDFGAFCSRAALNLATQASHWWLTIDHSDPKFKVLRAKGLSLEAESNPKLHNLKSDSTQVFAGPRKTFCFWKFLRKR